MIPLRRVDAETAEIKRMYTVPEHRRTGVGRAVLTEIEGFGRAAGSRRLILETGTEQPDAIALYTTSGYAPIRCYGVYRDLPMRRCYAKALCAPRP